MQSNKRYLSAAAVAFLLLLAAGKGAMGDPSLELVDGQPQVIVSGFNIYAPEVLNGRGSASVFFGGWLAEAQKPFDAIYRCELSWTGVGWDKCRDAQKISGVEQVPVPAQHVNDPTISCDSVSGECRYAVTVCIGECSSQLDAEIWIGKSDVKAPFATFVPFLGGNAAEPSGGSLPWSGSEVIYFTRRGNRTTIFAQPVNWTLLSRLGEAIPVIVDLDQYAVSSPAYAHVGGFHVLAWNRFEPVDFITAPGRLKQITVAYAIAADGNTTWTTPQVLLKPDDGLCGLITPTLAGDTAGRVELFVGTIAASSGRDCELNKWSKQIVRYNLILKPKEN